MVKIATRQKEKLKGWLRWLDARQQQPNYKLEPSTEEHTCPHCQTRYTGHFCPQCGMEEGTSQFTLRTLVVKLLDVMGFDESGNHSVLRTLRDLLWRPGYMIRDYLGGHSVAYFQPFKLLIFLTIIFTLLIHVLSVELEQSTGILEKLQEFQDNADFKPIWPLLAGVAYAIRWFQDNMVYSIIFQNFFIVNAMWKVYRHRAPYTWVETFIAQMYLCCQFTLLGIVQLLLTQRYHTDSLFPYLVSDRLVSLVLLYDFFQLYGEHRFWPALWRLLKVELWLIVQYVVLACIIIFCLGAYVGFVQGLSE